MLSSFSTAYIALAVVMIIVAAVAGVQYLKGWMKYCKVSAGLFVIVFTIWVIEDIRTLPQKGKLVDEDTLVKEETSQATSIPGYDVGEYAAGTGSVGGVNDVEVEDEIIVGKEYVLDTHTTGFGMDYLRERFDSIAIDKGLGYVSDPDAKVYIGGSRDMSSITSEDNPVSITTYLSKIDGTVTRVMVGDTGTKGINQKEVKEAVYALVYAMSPEAKEWEVRNLTNRLVSVSGGRIHNEVSNGIVYSSAKSKKTGLMVFVEGL